MTRDRLAIRTYASLLHMYPRWFRDEFGPDMVVLVRDQLRDESTPVVVARSLLDLVISIPTQHLEGHMRTPSRLVPIFLFGVAAAGLAVATVAGSEPAGLVVGLVVAAIAGAIGVAAWRQTARVGASTATEGWWKLLLVGPILIAGVILAAGVGVEAWFLGIVTIFTAMICVVLGMVLGVAHLVKTHARGAPA